MPVARAGGGLELVEVCLPCADECVPAAPEAGVPSDSGVFLEHGDWRIRLSRGFDAAALSAALSALRGEVPGC